MRPGAQVWVDPAWLELVGEPVELAMRTHEVAALEAGHVLLFGWAVWVPLEVVLPAVVS